MELKVACNCGQKYKFAVEPVSNRMPFAVNCPSCGADGTPLAHAQLSQLPPVTLQPAAVAPPPYIAVPPPISAPRSIPAALMPAYAPSRPANPALTGEFNFIRGIIGAVIGSLVSAGLMYGFYKLAGFRFPFLGIGVGAGTGYAAHWMAKGIDSTLGVIAAVIALAATCGSLFLIYGDLPFISLISVAVSASVAYRTAS